MALILVHGHKKTTFICLAINETNDGRVESSVSSTVLEIRLYNPQFRHVTAPQQNRNTIRYICVHPESHITTEIECFNKNIFAKMFYLKYFISVVIRAQIGTANLTRARSRGSFLTLFWPLPRFFANIFTPINTFYAPLGIHQGIKCINVTFFGAMAIILSHNRYLTALQM